VKTPTISVILLFVIGALTSAAQDVRYDFDKDKDFSQFKTYKWVPIKGANESDDVMAKQLVVAAVDAELGKKGLSKTDTDTADLYIGYQTAVRSEKKYSGWKFGPGWGRTWYGGTSPGEPYRLTSKIYVGQLDLSIYDSADKQLVWRGVASKTVDPNTTLDKQQNTINKAVEELLKNYPPKQNKK
jgi:hypothetical protein